MALSPKLIVRVRNDGQKGTFALAPIAKDEVLITYDGPVIDHATRYSIQIDDDRHIDGTPDSNANLNHSCDPNGYVDWSLVGLRAKRAITAGEEITCDYATTDYELHEPFTCRCGAANCRGEMRGFKYLSAEAQCALEPWLPEFLKRKLHARS